MEELERRGLLGAAGLVGIAAIARVAQAGPLDPPAGPIAPTGRTLEEIYSRAGIGIGRILIPGGTTAVVINQPGSYVLGGDLLVSSGAALTIASSNVSVDLNGYTLASNQKSAAGASISSGSGVILRNGRTTVCLTGVLIGSATGVILEDLQILGARQYGIATTGPGTRDIVIRRCTIEDIGATALAADNFAQIAAIYLQGSARPIICDNMINRLAYTGSGTPTINGMVINGPGTTGLMISRNQLVVPTGTVGVGVLMQSSTGIARDNSVIGFIAGISGLGGGGAGVTDGGGNVISL